MKRTSARSQVLAVGVIAILNACTNPKGLESSDQTAPTSPGALSPGRKVTLLTVTHQPFRSVIESSGTALPAREGYLSAAVPGRIQQILVKRGQRVAKGQPLLRLDRTGFFLGVEQAQAALAAAQVGIDSLETEMKRFDRLLANKAVPKASYDKVRAQYDGARAQQALAQVGTKQAKKALSDAELRAPYDGVITMILKEIGEYAPAMPPTMLMQIVDTSALQVQVFLPEIVASQIALGQKATIDIDSANLSRQGEVIFVSDRIQPGSQTFEVRIGLNNDDTAIKAGAFCRVRMVRRDQPQALLIPLRAVRREGNQTFIFIDQAGQARKQPVRLGESSRDRVLVLEGLNAGDSVITSTVSDLRDGEKIIPIQG